MIGFMGCYAGVPALRAARHIVRSDPAARVLVVNVELCSLHMQEVSDLQTVLTFLLFGDGATAALVTAEPHGLALHDFRSATLPDTQDLITWGIGDQGFDMHLSGQVPARIAPGAAGWRPTATTGGAAARGRPAGHPAVGGPCRRAARCWTGWSRGCAWRLVRWTTRGACCGTSAT